MNQQHKHIILLIGVVLLVFVVAAWHVNGLSTREDTKDNTREYTLQNEHQNTTSSAVVEYENKTVGLRFEYPDTLVFSGGKIWSGETGKSFSGVLKAESFWISFGGVTDDFTESRGGSIFDTTGYPEPDQDGKYYLWGNIEPTGFIPINRGNDKALVVENTEVEMLLNASSTAAFINIPNSAFPGMVFVLKPVRKQILPAEAEEIFRDIVSSVQFIE